jgi:hypothetical protein
MGLHKKQEKPEREDMEGIQRRKNMQKAGRRKLKGWQNDRFKDRGRNYQRKRAKGSVRNRKGGVREKMTRQDK